MNLLKSLGMAGIAASFAVCASLVSADPKPKNSKASDNQTVANFYAGTTRLWDSCNGGGVYFGGGWEAQAYCKKKGESVGLGKWSVKRGVICTELVWYWKDGDSVGSKPADKKDCIAHVTDAEGQMWRRWNDDADWWRVQPIKKDKKADNGRKLNSKIKRARKKIGV